MPPSGTSASGVGSLSPLSLTQGLVPVGAILAGEAGAMPSPSGRKERAL